MNNNSSEQTLDEILLDPTKYYKHPKEVIDDTRFDKNQKLEILNRWEYDAKELEIADDENMPADNSNMPDLLDEVLAAIDLLKKNDG